MEGPSTGRRHLGLANALRSEIEQGRYKVGDMLPTEAELQTRFNATRYGVREALKSLREAGLIVSTPGVGTVVRASAPARRYMQGFGTLPELIQLADAVRMKLLDHHTFITDADAARLLDVSEGQQWIEMRVLRYSSEREQRPTCFVHTYLRPEHADVLQQVDSSSMTVHGMIEQRYGVRMAEVRQRIGAMPLDPSLGEHLAAPAGSSALKITRVFKDALDVTVMASVGVYPHDRYTYDTVFRVLQES